MRICINVPQGFTKPLGDYFFTTSVAA